MTDLISPISTKLNPTYFLKKKESLIYPTTSSFGTKHPRFKKEVIFFNEIGPGQYSHHQGTIYKNMVSSRLTQSQRQDIKNNYVNKVYPIKIHHRLGKPNADVKQSSSNAFQQSPRKSLNSVNTLMTNNNLNAYEQHNDQALTPRTKKAKEKVILIGNVPLQLDERYSQFSSRQNFTQGTFSARTQSQRSIVQSHSNNKSYNSKRNKSPIKMIKVVRKQPETSENIFCMVNDIENDYQMRNMSQTLREFPRQLGPYDSGIFNDTYKQHREDVVVSNQFKKGQNNTGVFIKSSIKEKNGESFKMKKAVILTRGNMTDVIKNRTKTTESAAEIDPSNKKEQINSTRHDKQKRNLVSGKNYDKSMNSNIDIDTGFQNYDLDHIEYTEDVLKSNSHLDFNGPNEE